MAKGSIMLQIAVEQFISSAVTSIPEIWAVALDSLDGDRTIVREIASEESRTFNFTPDEGYSSPTGLHITATPLTDLWLAFPELRRPPLILHAPSHVSSPPIDGARLALLRVRDFGYDIEHVSVSVGRRVGSHAYLDEVLPS